VAMYGPNRAIVPGLRVDIASSIGVIPLASFANGDAPEANSGDITSLLLVRIAVCNGR